jgi:phospholipid/cholesterol/gamma-HCH transport system permease protein
MIVRIVKEDIFASVGKRTIYFIKEFGAISILLWYTITGTFANLGNKITVKNSYEQMVKIGIDSLPVSLVTALFVGMVFAVQIATEFTKFGAGKMVGAIMALAVSRELAPLLTAVVLAGRVGASIAAELGTMNVTQQIDAIKTLGTTPVKYLVIPRFFASAVMYPVITIFADIIGFIGAYIVSVYVVQINSYGYMETAEQFLKINDVIGGLIKALVFGMLIAIIASYKGLHAKNGAKGVGEATTSAVVVSLGAVFVANYFLSVAFFK